MPFAKVAQAFELLAANVLPVGIKALGQTEYSTAISSFQSREPLSCLMI